MNLSAVSSFSTSAVEPMPQPSAVADDDGFGFDDLLDIVNPLQHIPLIGSLYREITGDDIGLPARLAGGALFGGAVGFLASLGTAAFEGIVGQSTDEMFASVFESDTYKADPDHAVRAYQAASSLID
jgi:hypothetical protein